MQDVRARPRAAGYGQFKLEEHEELALLTAVPVVPIVEAGRLVWNGQRWHQEPLLTWTTLGGVTAGIAVMYLTALLVTA